MASTSAATTPSPSTSSSSSSSSAGIPAAKDFPVLENDCILRAALGEPTPYIPIWCHRQAGRYLPEFRAMRTKADFFTMVRTPSLAAEITIQPIQRLDLDAAIIFSDILVIPQALGMEVKMEPNVGPVLPKPLEKPEDIKNLNHWENPQQLKQLVKKELNYVFDAITLTRHQLKGKVPLLGFSGAPWTLMAYMVEGGGSKSYNDARAWFYKYPSEAHHLLQLLTDIIIEYCIQQIEAGAQMLEIFDTWASDLSPSTFWKFSFPYLQQISQKLKAFAPKIPITLFAKGANSALEKLSKETLFDTFSLDWNCPIEYAKQQISQSGKTLQGNLDVSVLYAEEKVIREEVKSMINLFGTQKYIANLGHGMLPSHPIEGLQIFIDEVHKYSKILNEKKL